MSTARMASILGRRDNAGTRGDDGGRYVFLVRSESSRGRPPPRRKIATSPVLAGASLEGGGEEAAGAAVGAMPSGDGAGGAPRGGRVGGDDDAGASSETSVGWATATTGREPASGAAPRSCATKAAASAVRREGSRTR